jgi:hypothetical protein
MNLHKAWEGRDKLNEKMSLLLLQGLRQERINYLRVIENYPPERMEKYGKPFLEKLDHKISTITQLIAEKFTNQK